MDRETFDGVAEEITPPSGSEADGSFPTKRAFRFYLFRYSPLKGTKGLFKINLGWYVAEILVVFVGITLSFFFDEWRKDRRDEKRKTELIESLYKDVSVKIAEMRSDSQDVEFLLEGLGQVVKSSEAGGITAKERDFIFLISNLPPAYFDWNTPTYDYAASTEDWFLLPDSLQRVLHHFYYNSLNFCRETYATKQNATTDLVNRLTATLRPLPLRLPGNEPFSYRYNYLPDSISVNRAFSLGTELNASLVNLHNQLLYCKLSLSNALGKGNSLLLVLDANLAKK